ncbi:MAG TPA: sulfotransferase domain-containing protein [Casimicrobiaceae bacterium]
MKPHSLPFDADVYVLSYPKAGRTWLRALVGKTLVDRYHYSERRMLDVQALTRLAGVPEIGFDHDGSAQRLQVRWQDMATDRDVYAGKRVLLLGRDVRDNLVSAYLQATRRVGAWNEPISAFVRDERYGVDKVLNFYRIWSASRHIPAAFMYVRYEDMHADTAGTLARVLPFLGIGVEAAAIDAAVEYCRFDNLRRAEVERRFRGSALVPKNPDDPESYKVRKGKVGNYAEYLSPANVAFIDTAVAERGCEFTRASLEH